MRPVFILLALLLPFAAVAQVVSASRLIGAALLDAEGQRLGYVTDLAVDLTGGEVRYAMVHSSGRYVPGAAVHGVSLRGLRPAAQRDHLVLAHSAEIPPATGRERMARASSLIGRDVDNGRGKLLGEIADLAVELESGRVHNAVFELDDGTRLSLPLTAFRFPELGGNAVLEGDKP